jgi:ABC-type glycerol-3-phosphate transport system permease component
MTNLVQARRTGRGATADEGGMGYLETLPRKVVTVYVPLAIFVFVLLFPFYWMAVCAFKTNQELHAYKGLASMWVWEPTLDGSRRWRTSVSCCGTRITRGGCGTPCW